MVLIYCLGRTVWVLAVSFTAALRRILRNKATLKLSLRMTSGSVVLVSYIYVCSVRSSEQEGMPKL